MTEMLVCMILSLVRNEQTWLSSSEAGGIYGGMIVMIWPILEALVLTAEVAAKYIVSSMANGAKCKWVYLSIVMK